MLIAWQCYQQVRSAYATTDDLAAGNEIAEKIVATFASCPIPEVARLGRTLRQWKATYLSYSTTARSSNGGTEAINGLIELHRRIARGYRNRHNCRLRMRLIAGGLDPTHPHRKSHEPRKASRLARVARLRRFVHRLKWPGGV